MAEVQFTDADISAFLTGLIELGGIYTVDDSPDKYIRKKSDGKPETITIDKRNMPLAVFGTKATDALIINPFAEGETDTEKHTWFYATRNMTLAAHIVALVTKILEVGAAAQKKAKDEKEPENMATVRLISKHVLDVDEKMVKEFKTISKELTNFFTIYYNKSTKQGEVSCLIFKQAQRKPFTSVRVKTWDVLEGIMEDILGTKDLSDFNYRPTVIGAPYFECFANILVKMYETINDKLVIIDKQIPNELLGSLRSHLKYFPQYCGRAQWCSSPTPIIQPTAAPVFNGGINPMTLTGAAPVINSTPNLIPVTSPVAMPQNVMPYGATGTGMLPPMQPQPAMAPLPPVMQPGVMAAPALTAAAAPSPIIYPAQTFASNLTPVSGLTPAGLPQMVQQPLQEAYSENNPFSRA